MDVGNVDNLDAFLQEVYAYYVGRGAICIALSRSLNLLTVAFVISFSTFLFGCIDYSAIQHDGQLSDVIVGHCVAGFSPFSTLLVVLLLAAFGWQVVQFVLGLSRAEGDAPLLRTAAGHPGCRRAVDPGTRW